MFPRSEGRRENLYQLRMALAANLRFPSLKVWLRERPNRGEPGSTRFSICSNFAGSCPIELKIELCTDREHSRPFPGCFCDSTIFGTPLAQFSSQGGQKFTKVAKHRFTVVFSGFRDRKTCVMHAIRAAGRSKRMHVLGSVPARV